MRIYKFAVFALTWPQKSRKRLVLLVRSSCFLKVGEASRRTALLCVGGGAFVDTYTLVAVGCAAWYVCWC